MTGADFDGNLARMSARIEFYFDFSCPFAYLGSTRIERVAAAGGAELIWRPMLLGGVFAALDRPEEKMAPAKALHNLRDWARWGDVLGVTVRMPPGHPNRTVRALRALLALPEERWPRLIHAAYRAYWVDGADLSREETVAACLDAAGVDPALRARALAANDDPAIKDELRRRTDEAVARGVFGAPATFVGGHMFWGQDRLFMVERVLAGWQPKGLS